MSTTKNLVMSSLVDAPPQGWVTVRPTLYGKAGVGSNPTMTTTTWLLFFNVTATAWDIANLQLDLELIEDYTGVDGTADGSPATIYKAPTSVSLFYYGGNYITYTV